MANAHVWGGDRRRLGGHRGNRVLDAVSAVGRRRGMFYVSAALAICYLSIYLSHTHLLISLSTCNWNISVPPSQRFHIMHVQYSAKRCVISGRGGELTQPCLHLLAEYCTIQIGESALL